MMVVVKTDTEIFLNVVSFEASKGISEKMGSHDICVERPGLYIRLSDCDYHYNVIGCSLETAKKFLDGIANIIDQKLAHSNVVVFKVHDNVITCDK